MNGKERMNLAMHRKEPDRVPVMCQPSTGHILLNSGVSPVDFLFTNEGYTRALLQIREKFDFDGILVTPRGRNPDWLKNATKITNEKECQIVYFKDGRRTICPYDESPVNHPDSHPDPPALDEVNVEEVVYMEDELADYRLEVTDIVIKEAGNSFSIHGSVGSPFTYFLQFFGLQEALIYLVDNPVKCKEIIAKFGEQLEKLAMAQIERGVDAMKINSPYAGSGFISLNYYREFVLPYETKLIHRIKQGGVPCYIHTCGFIGDRLELMADTGANGIECLDPPPLGDVDLADAMKRIGNKMFIKGNIDSVNTLLKKSNAEVIEDAKNRIAIAGPEGGYILSTACAIAPRVPSENVKVLRQVVEKYGQYPINF